MNPVGIKLVSIVIISLIIKSASSVCSSVLFLFLNPNVAKMYRGKTRQGAPDVASRRLGKVEAYLTVREILPEASKGADGVAWCEFSGFGR